MSVHFCTFGISFFHDSKVSELLNKNKNIDTMNKSSMYNVVKRRITRGSEKKKKEEDDLKKKTKIHNVVRTRLEEKKMRSLEESRLRSEDVGLSSIFNDDNDGSDTSMEMIKDEVILHFKQLFRTNLLHHLGSNNLT